MILEKNYLEKLKPNAIINLAEFIVTENFKHHSNNILPKNYENDVKSIYKEEISYIKNSEIFVAKGYLRFYNMLVISSFNIRINK